MKDVGTLEEIGAKLGDVVSCEVNGWMGMVSKVEHGQFYSGGIWLSMDAIFRMLRRAAAKHGPVREVTRREIVPGVYGNVEVSLDAASHGVVGVYINSQLTADELAAAIATLTEIHNAMKEGVK